MEKLLQWGIKNSDPEELAKATSNEAVKDLDPEVIDAILGKSEATMMKENFQVIIDENVDLEQREVAFDNLEMLVEHIDNAKNLTPLKLWAPLIELLKNEHSVIRKYTAWTLGTATQNNPDAQEAFIQHNGFEALLQAMEKESEKEVLIKLIYALSCATRHHQKSLVKLQTLNGFQLIQNIVNRKDIDVQVISRILFMMNSLLSDEPTILTPLLNSNLLNTFLMYLLPESKYYDDDDLIQKDLHLLSTSLPLLNSSIDIDLKSIAKNIESLKQRFNDIFTEQEWDTLIAKLNN